MKQFERKEEILAVIKECAQRGDTIKEIKEICNQLFPEHDFTDQKVRDFIRNNNISHKKRIELRVMDAKERDLAEKNINVVYDYLHRNHLEIEEWFDIVIFGYLDAVMDYNRKENLRRHAFTTIAWHEMRREISNYKRKMQSMKRPQEVISLDEIRTESGQNLFEILSEPLQEEKYKEIEFEADLRNKLCGKFNQYQCRQIFLMYCGYKGAHLEKILKLNRNELKKNIEYIRFTISKSGLVN